MERENRANGIKCHGRVVLGLARFKSNYCQTVTIFSHRPQNLTSTVTSALTVKLGINKLYETIRLQP